MSNVARSARPASAAVASALRALSVERAGIAALEAELAGPEGLGGAFEAAVALIRAASGRVVVTGMGKSGHVGRKIAATLASTGAPAFFVHPGEASHGDLGMILEGDVVLALSWSGETAELADLITHAARFAVGLIAMTANATGALARAADVALILPRAEEACPNGLAPTTSTTMQLALGDALAIALLEARGFTAQDFGRLHPGGKLGAKLRYAADLMHGADQVPLTPAGATMADAVVEMSAKGFGCVAVVDEAGRLVGVITDGDLRRHMRADLMAAPVAQVMTRAPQTVSPTTLAAEALEILNARKITALFVVDAARRPRGVLHVHDLLRAGVA